MQNTNTRLITIVSDGNQYHDYREFERDYFDLIKTIMDQPNVIESFVCPDMACWQRLGYLIQCALWRMPSSDKRMWLQTVMFELLHKVKDELTPVKLWYGQKDQPIITSDAASERWMIVGPINYSRLRQFLETGGW